MAEKIGNREVDSSIKVELSPTQETEGLAVGRRGFLKRLGLGAVAVVAAACTQNLSDLGPDAGMEGCDGGPEGCDAGPEGCETPEGSEGSPEGSNCPSEGSENPEGSMN